MMAKSVKLEARTYTLLKQRKIKKVDGNFETFNDVIRRLVNEKEADSNEGEY